MGQLIDYIFEPKKLQLLTENVNGNKIYKVRGVFQRADEKNANGRLYPLKVLESQVKYLDPKIKERALVGATDHPESAIVHLKEASHVITKLWMDGPVMMGEAEILPTPTGSIVKTLLEHGVKVGISSRGTGTVTEMEEGVKVVNEDFKLLTFDLVADPSTKDAYVSLSESVEHKEKRRELLSKITKQVLGEQVFLTLLKERLTEGRR